MASLANDLELKADRQADPEPGKAVFLLCRVTNLTPPRVPGRPVPVSTQTGSGGWCRYAERAFDRVRRVG